MIFSPCMPYFCVYQWFWKFVRMRKSFEYSRKQKHVGAYIANRKSVNKRSDLNWDCQFQTWNSRTRIEDRIWISYFFSIWVCLYVKTLNICKTVESCCAQFIWPYFIDLSKSMSTGLSKFFSNFYSSNTFSNILPQHQQNLFQTNEFWIDLWVTQFYNYLILINKMMIQISWKIQFYIYKILVYGFFLILRSFDKLIQYKIYLIENLKERLFQVYYS